MLVGEVRRAGSSGGRIRGRVGEWSNESMGGEV